MIQTDDLAAQMVRDIRGRFAKAVCVNAHDRCYLGGPCPWCEIRAERAGKDGQ